MDITELLSTITVIPGVATKVETFTPLAETFAGNLASKLGVKANNLDLDFIAKFDDLTFADFDEAYESAVSLVMPDSESELEGGDDDD